MVYIKILDVFAGNDIDLFIPFIVQSIKQVELIFLEARQIWKVMEYNVYGLQIKGLKK